MSRTKGYKCFNIKCGSCIGKTLCGEPEDTALVCVDRVIGKPMTNADRIRAMNDEELAEFLIDLADDGNLRIREWLQRPAGEEEQHELRRDL